MKTEKITEKDLKALLGLGMIVMVALAYFLGFHIFLEDTKTMKLENIQLESRVSELREKDRNKEQIIKETEEYNAKIDAIVARYPSKVTTEKVICVLDDLKSKLGKLQYSTVTFDMNSLFYPVTDGSADTEEAVKAQQSGYGDGAITVYKSVVTANVKNLSYTALKTLIDEVHNYDGRLTIGSMNLYFSQESGLLDGEIVFHFYALEGSANEYKIPDIPGVASGLKNIFGTFDKD